MVKNEKGVTLIEILAAVALLSVILLLANSMHVFGINQVSNQTTEIQNQSNDRLAISILTKEIRKASSVSVDNSHNILTIDNTDVYKLESNHTLTKNNQLLVADIQNFAINLNSDGDQISLTVGNVPTTTIYIRK